MGFKCLLQVLGSRRTKSTVKLGPISSLSERPQPATRDDFFFLGIAVTAGPRPFGVGIGCSSRRELAAQTFTIPSSSAVELAAGNTPSPAVGGLVCGASYGCGDKRTTTAAVPDCSKSQVNWIQSTRSRPLWAQRAGGPY
jgi:hypothetical protein